MNTTDSSLSEFTFLKPLKGIEDFVLLRVHEHMSHLSTHAFFLKFIIPTPELGVHSWHSSSAPLPATRLVIFTLPFYEPGLAQVICMQANALFDYYSNPLE